MSNEQRRPDLKHLWQGQPVEGSSLSADEIRSALEKLNRMERKRVWLCGAVCLLFVGALVGLLIRAAPLPIVRAAEGFFALGAGFFFFQVMLGLRRAPWKLLTRAEPQACAAFYRSVLERQQTFYRRSAFWLPLFITACLLPIILMAAPLRALAIGLWVLLVPFWIYESTQIARQSELELEKLNASSR